MTYFRIQNSDWIFIGLMPSETAVSEINRLTILIFLISAFMLTLFFHGLFVTRKLYRPIEQLDLYVRSKVHLTVNPQKSHHT